MGKEYPGHDLSGADQLGFGALQASIRDGRRCSAAKAYLVPADHRRNLDIVGRAYVTKVQIHQKKACGVWFDYKDKCYYVKARREVILCAGAIKTPHILMHSGIGPRKTLEKCKIKVHADLPVGKNYQDHYATVAAFEVKNTSASPYLMKLLHPTYLNEYAVNQSGPLSSPEGVFAINLIRSKGAHSPPGVPNIQQHWLEGVSLIALLTTNMKSEAYLKVFHPYETKPSVWCVVNAANPKSRGYVSLKSCDPMDHPKIDPNFFSDEHDRDLNDTVEGLKFCEKICTTPEAKKFGLKRALRSMPGCQHCKDDDDKYWTCYAKSFGVSLCHHCGTAKMGDPKDKTTVVDSKLRVKCIKNLRVVDASVIPRLISTNTNSPLYMIAEKGADMIKETIHCRRKRKHYCGCHEN